MLKVKIKNIDSYKKGIREKNKQKARQRENKAQRIFNISIPEFNVMVIYKP